MSGVGGNYADLNHEANALYGFRSQDVLAQIAPVPLVMIQSTSDSARSAEGWDDVVCFGEECEKACADQGE